MFNNLINSITYIFNKKYPLQDIFTPTSYAVLSYRNRPNIESRLESALLLTGRPIIIFGHTGSGKSTLLHYILKNRGMQSIRTQCTSQVTFNSLILDAFDKLNAYYTDKVYNSKKVEKGSSLKAEYLKISASINSSYESSEEIHRKRVVPPQLTPQCLANFLGAAEYVWIIEDFHKIKEEEKIHLAQTMKVFLDSSNDFKKAKIVIVGAVDTGNDITKYDKDLDFRVTQIEIPLLFSNEIKDILNVGTNLLNIFFDDGLKNEIVRYSNNLAMIAHQLAYNICYANKIMSTQRVQKRFGLEELNRSLQNFLFDQENTFKQLYDRVTEQRPGTFRNVDLILAALAEFKENEISQRDILFKILETDPKYPQGNLSTYLKKLCSAECEEVLRIKSGRYSFSNPFFKAYIRIMNGLTPTL